MPKLSRILSVFALFLFAVVAHSQSGVVTSVRVDDGAGTGSGAGQVSGNARVAGGFIGGFAGGGIGGVKGQPFSADVIDETDQFLADGNHIHRETHGKIFRDSQGRSRNENEVGGFMAGSKPFIHIQIVDPVEGAFITLDPEHKVATVRHFERSGPATGFKPAPRAAQPTQAGQSGTITPPPPDAQPLLQNLRDRQGQSASRQHSREDLGTMQIEGFTVKGVRYTQIVPAGSVGNDKPMTTTSEHWFSDDFNIHLLTKSSSPESGQHVRRLVNIRSGDPDPLVFQVPADYTVKEQQQ